MRFLFLNLAAMLVVNLFPFVVFSQQNEIDLPESWSEPLNEEVNAEPSVWSDLNEWYSEHPVFLPSATRSQLLELPGMDGLIAEAIVSYQSYPGFQSVADLTKIPEISSGYYSVLQFWVTMELPDNERSDTFRINSELRQRIRVKPGDSEISSFKSLYWYNRIKLKTNTGWMGGLIAEKDKGESKFADYLNGTLFYQSSSSTDRIIFNKFSVGSFQLAFGEGLLFSRSATLGKSSSVISSPVRNSNGLSPSLSSDENRFLFGTAGSIFFPDAGIETGLFYSSHRYDGKTEWIYGFDESEKLQWKEDFKFDYSGLHVDSSSFSGKDKLPVSLYGGWFEWSDGKYLSLTGVGGMQNLGEVNSRKDSTRLQIPDRSQRFSDLEKENRYFSLSVQGTSDFAIVSTEIATFNSKRAYAAWFLTEPIPGFKYILHRREADPGFNPLFGRQFADKMSSPGNESGWYHGLEISVKSYLFSFYRDEYRHPWPGYLKMYPSKGTEWFAGLEKRWQGNQSLKIQTRHSIEFENEGSEDPKSKTESDKTRAEWNNQLSPSIRIKFRVDYNKSVRNYSGKGLTGQLKLNFWESGNLVFQSTWFDANQYEDKIYVYESDLPGMMSFNPLYGEGVRLSVLAGNKFYSWFGVSVKGAFEHLARIADGEKVKKVDGFIGLQVDFRY